MSESHLFAKIIQKVLYERGIILYDCNGHMISDLKTAEMNPVRLKEAREASGMTQQQVADRIGITKQTLSNYECGHGLPSANVLGRLCFLYRIDAAGLLHNN